MAILSLEFDSVCLNRAVHVKVLLPADNDENKPLKTLAKPFKTLYLLHGMTGSQTDWLYKTEIDDLSRKYNLAVVMPAVENSFYIDKPVRREYFNRFVGEELVEFTRKLFPLSHSREDTFIGGLSMGGYGSALVGMTHSETFGAIISLSAAFIMEFLAKIKPGDVSTHMDYDYAVDVFGKPENVLGSAIDPKALAKKLVDAGGALPRFYIACGKDDYLIEGNRDYSAYLSEIGFPHEYIEGEGVHNWDYWRLHIAESLRWYYGE